MGIDDSPDVDDPAGSSYDAFISYSHAADDLLAPRLQSALQRFAKPWWKRRAMRVFRDQSSLAANPHLWASITEALDSTEWFVLLLSPDAAQSRWVNREIDYWLETKGAHRILPVVTAGEFVWNGDGSAVPPALRGAFSDEPRWVDMRFAHEEEHLDLRHGGFRNAVADVASAVRNIPKDELESEEVRQHRRTMRTAWAAGVVVALLAVAATVGAFIAFDQSNEARTQRDEAQRLAEAEATAREEADANAAEADEQRDAAEANAAEAERQRQSAEEAARQAERERSEAERQRSISEARALSLEAQQNLDVDAELSMLLALEAMDAYDIAGEPVPTAAISTLRQAIALNHVVARFPGDRFVAVHESDGLLATAHGDHVAVWSLITQEIVETYERDDGAVSSDAAFSPDGTLLAVTYNNSPHHVRVWDRRAGTSVDFGVSLLGETWNTPSPVFSPDGQVLVFSSPVTATSSRSALEVRSVDGWNEILRIALGEFPWFTQSGDLVYVRCSENPSSDACEIVTHDGVTSTSTSRPSPLPQALFFVPSPDGTRAAISNQLDAVIVDMDTLTVQAEINADRVSWPKWLPDGSAVLTGGESGARLFDAGTGEVERDFSGLVGGTWSYQIIGDGTRAVAAPIDGTSVVAFDLSDLGGFEVAAWSVPLENIWNVGYDSSGQILHVSTGGLFAFPGRHDLLVSSSSDGTELLTISGGRDYYWPMMSRDGSVVVYNDVDGLWSVIDTGTGRQIYQAPEGWEIHAIDATGELVALTTGGGLFEGCSSRIDATDGSTSLVIDAGCMGRASFTSDGRILVAGDNERLQAHVLVDTSDGSTIAIIPDDPYWGLAHGLSPDASTLAIGAGGQVHVFDFAELVAGTSADDALRFSFPAHENLILSVEISPDGGSVLTSSWDDKVKLWDLATGAFIDEFGGDLSDVEGQVINNADFHPSLPHIAVTTPPNEVRIHTLDLTELRQIARDRVTRGFTAEECLQYQLTTCADG